MIDLYSGTPGSGKSLHVSQVMYYRLRAGRPVLANFPFAADRCGRGRGRNCFTEISNDEISPKFLVDFADSYFSSHRYKEDAILLVLDEAQLLFNAREWSAAGRKEWLSFFTQHRKYGYHIILVAQFDRMLDRQIRSVLEYEYIHRKVSNFGVWGKIIAFWSLGRMFCAVRMWYPLHERVGADWFIARPKYYRLYDTYRRFDHVQLAPHDAAAVAVNETTNINHFPSSDGSSASPSPV